MFDLDADERRVLGTLIEKQLATPQYYPLTLSALVQACNQSTSRDPVTNYSESDVRSTLQRLKDKELIRTVLPSHGRSVDRYGHRLNEHVTLIQEEIALLGVLMLRGPQTEAELKSRTERLAPWEAPDTPASVLDRLVHKPEPLARNIGRGRGRHDRWVDLLGDIEPTFTEPVVTSGRGAPKSDDRLGDLEARVAKLEAEIAELREQLGG
ncbi:MAG: DUF480 domain-containing protein [Actinobacteria bacterium]|nr:DUF480 domain-containing protein [Actinomycetota bacterium]